MIVMYINGLDNCYLWIVSYITMTNIMMQIFVIIAK